MNLPDFRLYVFMKPAWHFFLFFLFLSHFGWTQHSIVKMDMVKVKNDFWKETLFYYENNWKKYRDIALQKGYIQSYQLIKVMPDSLKQWDIILITEYKDKDQESKSEERFNEIIKSVTPNGPALLNSVKPKDFRENLYLAEGSVLFSSRINSLQHPLKTDSNGRRDEEAQAAGHEWNKDLAPEKKIYILSDIWKNVSENFAFFDNVPMLNWDSLYQAYLPKVLMTSSKFEFYRLLEQFVASLRDGHTLLLHFNDLFPHYGRFSFNNNLRLYPEAVNKRVFITRVGNQQMTNIIPLGTEIIEVNGLKVMDYLNRFVFPYIAASTEQQLWVYGVPEMFRGVLDTEVKNEWDVKFKKPDGTINSMRLTLTKEPGDLNGKSYPVFQTVQPLESRWLPGGIYYLALNTFTRDTVLTLFKAVLPEIQKAKAVVIDLRRNDGGNSNLGAEILGYFTNMDTLIGSRWQTRISNAYYKSNGYILRHAKNLDEEDKEYLKYYRNESWMEGGQMKFRNNSPVSERLHMPLVVLTSHFTVSAGEDFLIMLEGLKGRAVRIGQVTAGSSGQRIGFRISTGGSYFICTKKDTYPDGRKFVGVGIAPDIEVNPEINDIIMGRDVILETALDFLGKKK